MSEYFLERQTEPTNEEPVAPQKPKNTWKKRVLLGILGALFLVGIIYTGWIIKGLPPLDSLENVKPPQVTRLFSSDGNVLHELYRDNRIWVSIDRIPDHIIKATLATEDREFYDHWGINIKRIPRAALVNLRTMSFSQGSSTITMQVARNLYQKEIGFERSIHRKIREAITATQIERTYSKREILEMYLNVAYFGRGSYGLQSAARRFFDKEVSDLNIEEGALLVGMLKGPGRYNPTRHPERTKLRRDVVMHNMFVTNDISRQTYDSLKVIEMETRDWKLGVGVAPYFTEHVRQELNALQDSLNIDVYEDGLNVFTTLQSGYQTAMDSAIARQMPAIQSKVRKYLKSEFEKKERETGETISDSLFEKKSVLQIAFIAMDHRTGEIKAMVGGRDFKKTKFNRALQARRQPGSTFKPFLYTAAIDNGYTPIDKLLNQPVVINNGDGSRWTPENYDRTFGGLTSLREGVRRSLNIIAARLILDIGPQVVVNYARRMGISTELTPYPSLAMGSTGTIPLEMVNAFGVLANEGVKVEPIFIRRIEDRYGNVIFERFPKRQEVISRASAYIMTDMLSDVINAGTGVRIRSLYNFRAPAAGKTGTTNDYADAWFIGYTPHVTAGVWVGLDSPELKMGPEGVGSRAALPFWGDFMKTLYDLEKIPADDFKQPPDVVRMEVCRESGKRAVSSCPDVYSEIFNIKFRVSENCDVHTAGNQRKSRNLFGF